MTKKIIITLIILLVLAGLGYYFLILNQTTVSNFETAKAEIRNLIQTVEETGRVKAQENVNLSFNQSGTLKQNLVQVGDEVKSGDILAELDHDGLLIQKREAEIRLEATQIRLRRIQAGASFSEIQVVESQLNQARENYDSAVRNLEETQKTVANNLKQAEERLFNLKDNSPETTTPQEQAITSAQKNLSDTKKTYEEQINRNKESVLSTTNNSISVANAALDEIDQIINNQRLRNLGVLGATKGQVLAQTENHYEASKEKWNEAKLAHSLARENNSKENIFTLLEKTIDLLNSTASALDYCFQTLENSITSSEFTLTQLNTYKTSINQQITSVSSALSSTQGIKHSLESSYSNYEVQVTSAENLLQETRVNLEEAIRNAENSLRSAQVNGEQQITSAQNQIEATQKSLEVARSQLNQIKSPARTEDVLLAQVEIDQARAALDLINETIRNSILISPIDGKIAKLNFEAGEIISPQTPAVQILSPTNFKIEVDVSEIDIPKISLGDEVTITLDSFGPEKTFQGQVGFIDPAETIIQEVIYYKVTINFTANNNNLDQVKPGMTANITIHTEQKNNVLAIPNRAIIERANGSRIVRIPKNSNDIEEREIRTGLRGNEGLTEITQGLKEGEEVITFIEN